MDRQDTIGDWATRFHNGGELGRILQNSNLIYQIIYEGRFSYVIRPSIVPACSPPVIAMSADVVCIDASLGR